MAFSVGTLIGYLKLEGGPQFTAGVRSAQESLDLTARAAVRTGAAVDKTGAALTNAGRQADVAAVGTNRLKAAELSLVAAQERYNKVTADSTASTGRLASSQAALIRAQDRVRASQPITPASVSAVGAMQTKIRSLIGDTAKMAAGFAVIGGIFELGNAIKQANAFQRQMLLIQTQAGASAAQVKSLTASVLALSPQVATSPEQLAVSLYHIESAGRGLMSTAQMLDTLKIAAEGAKIGNADLEQTTNALTSTVASGIGGVQNMAQAMGMLNATVGAGDMKLSDLNEALGSGLLAVVKTYGLNLRDVGAALATFGDNNIRGANAATMLRMAVQSMAVPMKTGQASLELLGLKSNTLAQDMQSGGLNKAILDLSAHLKQVGKGQEITDLSNQMQSFNGHIDATTVQASSLGETLTTVFGKRAGPGLAVLLAQTDRLQEKYKALDQGATSFGAAWDATTHTASFGFEKLKASAEAAGISIFSKVGPALGQVASEVGVGLTGAIAVLKSAVSALHPELVVLGAAFAVAGGALKLVVDSLHALAPVLGPITAGIAGMWAAMKLAPLAIGAFTTLKTAILGLPATIGGARAAMLGFWTEQVAASRAAAVGTTASMGVIEDEAALMSGALVADGEAAAVGWAGLLGPIGAVAVGIGVLITMFGRSKGASKEATDAAKAYTEALKSGGSGDVSNSIVDQLSKNNVPEKIAALNKALGQTQFTGKQFVDAIKAGNPALDDLKKHLNDVIAANTKFVSVGGRGGASRAPILNDAAKTAKKLLADLKDQAAGLSDAAQKELADAATFGQVASSITQVSLATEVGSQTAQTYAQMMGILIDKNGIAAVSSTELNRAVDTVATAYGTATQTADGYLAALNTFSGSAGTANDRAALMGATLKAANGDALNFAGQMNGLAQATSQFATDMASNAKTAGTSVKTYLGSIVDLKHGTIDYNKAAAGPLINDLQGIQTAAMNAAEATFQHNVQTEGSKKAADDAYTAYQSMTSGALTRYLISIGEVDKKTGKLNTSAQKLVDTYFGMPADVKTQIEQEGADTVTNILERIELDMRAIQEGKTVAQIVAEDHASGTMNAIEQQLWNLTHQDHTIIVNERMGTVIGGSGPAAGKHIAAGGLVTGPGTGTSDSIPARLSNGEFVVRASQTAKHRDLLHAINSGSEGFAGGGPVGDFTVAAGSKAAGTSHTNKVKVTLDSISISAGGGAAYGIADLIKGNISQSTLAMRDLSAAVNDAFQLSGVQKKLASVAADLKQLQSDASQLRANVEGTLSTSVDVSKYADIGGLMSALGGGTAANTKFAGELNKLKGEGAPTMLLQKLAEAGPSAGLDTLANASLGQARQAFGAYSSYISSANLGGNSAYSDVYGARIAADQKSIASLTKSQTALSNDVAKLVGAIARVTKRPISVTLNGHTLATAVIKDSAFDGVINEITHSLVHG